MKGPAKIVFFFFFFFLSVKNPFEALNKLKLQGFPTSSSSTHDFSTLYTTLPNNRIKDKLVDLTERIFQR